MLEFWGYTFFVYLLAREENIFDYTMFRKDLLGSLQYVFANFEGIRFFVFRATVIAELCLRYVT
jgi:hypothetical protein